MVSKILKFHYSKKIPVFVKAQEMIEQGDKFSIEEIVKTIDELSKYENEIKKIKHRINMATDQDIMSILFERARAG